MVPAPPLPFQPALNREAFGVGAKQVLSTTSAAITAWLDGASRSTTLTDHPSAVDTDAVSIARADYAVGDRRAAH